MEKDLRHAVYRKIKDIFGVEATSETSDPNQARAKVVSPIITDCDGFYHISGTLEITDKAENGWGWILDKARDAEGSWDKQTRTDTRGNFEVTSIMFNDLVIQKNEIRLTEVKKGEDYGNTNI